MYCILYIQPYPLSAFVCACVYVCESQFGLGQLQLCQSEPLQMPKLPEEEEKGGARGKTEGRAARMGRGVSEE